MVTPMKDKSLSRRWLLVPLLASVAVLAAACSASSSATSRLPTTLPSTPATSGPGTGPSSDSASPGPGGSTTTVAVSQAITPCTTQVLSVSAGARAVAAGTIVAVFVVKNSSSAACSLSGYPQLKLVAGSGASLASDVVDGNGPAIVDRQVGTVDLAGGGGEASFLTSWTDVPVGTETSCPTSASVVVSLPGIGGSYVVTDQISACGGGRINVSPVVSGVARPQ